MSRSNTKSIRFADFATTSPNTALKRGADYTFVPMEAVDGQSKYPRERRTKKYTGGGAKFQNGDTIFARITPCLQNGKIAKVKGLDGGVGFGSTEFFVFRAKDCVSDPDYLYYLARTEAIRGVAEKSMTGASGRQRANLWAIEKVEVHAPSLEEQKEIAGILSVYDDLIENNTRRIKALEEMAQAIYTEWFVRFRFPGHETVKRVVSGTEFGEIPEGWEVKRLGEIVTTQYGYTESAEIDPVGPKYLRGTDINKESYVDWASVPYCKIDARDNDRYALKRNDIVIIRMADPGKIGIVERNVDAIFASYLIRLSITSCTITPYYLFYYLISDFYQNYITGASSGTTRKSVSAKVVTGTHICVASIDMQEKFAGAVVPLRDELNILLMQNEKLRQARDLLLPRLIR